MGVISLPQNKNWDVSYQHDGAATIVDSYNVDLFAYPNKVICGPKIIPHTTDTDVASIVKSTAFGYSNYASGNRAYIALCGQLLKATNTSSLFATALSEGSPTNLNDSDFVIQGMSSGGYDIAVLSWAGETGVAANLSRFNYDISASAFNNYWWSGYPQTITSTTNATPVVVTMSADHNYTTGDKVVIRDNSVAANNGQWTITVTATDKFSIDNTVSPGATGTGGKAYRFYDILHTLYESLGQKPLTGSIAHPLLVFGNAPLLFVCDKNLLHSVAPYYTNIDGTLTQPGPTEVQYSRLAFKKNYTINWIRANSEKIFIGLKSDMGDWYPSLVEEYDPFSEQVREITIDEGATMGFMFNNALFIIDYKGNIKGWTGAGFEKQTSFPSIAMKGVQVQLPHRNGIAATEDRVFILMPESTGYTRAGVWCYDPAQKQVYHYASLTHSGTVLNAYGETLARGDTYYGALFFVNPTTLLAGASVTSSVESSTVHVSGVFSTLPKPSATPAVDLTATISRFTTGKLYSDKIDTQFNRVIVHYNATPSALGYTPTGKIVTWYRTSDDYRTIASSAECLWTSATTFTTPTAGAPSAGDSIEVWRGGGSGVLGSVLSVSAPSGGRVTVTLTESPLTVTPSGRFYFKVSNWKRIPTTSDITDMTKNWAEVDIPTTQSSWVQLMFEVRGFVAIESLKIGISDGLKVESV